VYGEGAVTMEEVVGRSLAARGLTVATAESCTAGLIAHRLTQVPGSTDWVRGGVVAYGPTATDALLGVRAETLARHGAVSPEVAGEMASGVRSALGASIGISTTGVAGPEGGTAETPVGTVVFGLAAENGVFTHRYQLWGTRDWVKLLASQVALDWLRRHALGLPLTDRLFRSK
jgi:nicotinamide-nucleotide amidase